MPGRDSISLDGDWIFTHANDGLVRQAPVPMPWQAAFADLRQTSGRALYSRHLPRPDLASRVAVLRFGAVSWSAVVRLNGTELSRHDNGWLPFEVTIPDALWQDNNLLEVDCLLPGADPETADGVLFDDIPHGKQSWYGPAGGIWQSVMLDLRPVAHLRHCALQTDVSGEVAVTTEWTMAANGQTAHFAIAAPDGRNVATGEVTVAGGLGKTVLTVTAPALWSPDTPMLYRLTVSLDSDETQHDFGFRSIAVKDGKILLNGAPFYMRGALDQDYWPIGLQTPPSLAAIEDQFRKARALGLNTLRCHIKVPDPRYYDVADRLGLLIWTEIPNVGRLTDASALRMRQTMEGILRRDGNHPSIAIWTLINEDWGTRTFDDPAHRAWLAAEYDWLKAADPARLVVDNSPCHNNFHLRTDIADFHYYRSVPERRAEWDQLTAEFAANADWIWSPHGDALRRVDEPLIVSEFGVWGLPNPADVRIEGAQPEWMQTGATWGDGAAFPHGIASRFADLRLGRVFGGFDAFIEAAQQYQFANLKYQIESMRGWPSIQGYVVTEFTDVHWESNGLLDMNRNPRAFAADFAAINADIVVLPRPENLVLQSGETITLRPAIATGGASVSGAVLHWSEGESEGTIPVPDAGPTALVDLPDLIIPLKGPARMVRLEFRLMTGNREIARNHQIITLLNRAGPAAISLRIPDPDLAERARALGYEVSEKGSVTLVHALADADIRALQAGATYVVLADGTLKTHGNLRVEPARREQPFMPVTDDIPGLLQGAEAPLPNIGLVARHGTMWRGDWIASFSWLRRDGAFAAIPGGPMPDAAWADVIPRHVMTGFRPHDFGGPVLAGLVVGWVHKPATTLGWRRVGLGNLLATTYRLCSRPVGEDLLATALFDAIVATAAKGPVG